MKARTLTLIFVATWLAGGCGARTSDDELLGYSRTAGWGGEGSGGDGPHRGSGGENASGGSANGTGGGSGGSIQSPESCCVTHSTSGCQEAGVEQCVCETDPYCCGNQWDAECVNQALNDCSASCLATGGTGGVFGSGGASTTTGGNSNSGGSGGAQTSGNCCTVHDGTGCEYPVVSSCVCDLDPYCCQVRWDATCVQEADSCDASCSLTGSGGGGGSTSSGGGGGSTGGGGGSTSSGGASSWMCEDELPGECGACLCSACYSSLNSCRNDVGCLSILSCVQATGCSGFGCYQSGTCRNQIDNNGGLGGSALINALSLYACTSQSACPCN